MRSRVDVFVKVNGGGITGQGGAVSQGVARALKLMFGLSSGATLDGKDTISKMARNSATRAF